jgi:hypothetical protein
MAHVQTSLVAKNGLSLSHRNASFSFRYVSDVHIYMYVCIILTQCVCVCLCRKSHVLSGNGHQPLTGHVGQRKFDHQSRRVETYAVKEEPPMPAGFVREEPLRIERVSFGSILTPVGLGLLIYGFGAFFQMLPGGDVSSLLLIYGFPISLLGFALSYAQLRPVPCFSQPRAVALRETQATDIQNQLRDDVTRFRYGDEQHLDEALSRIFRFGQAGGLPRRFCPILVAVREEVRDGDRYTLVLDFETKEGMEDEEWVSRREKIETFFGPGITVELLSKEGGQEVALVCDGSGSGRGGGEKKDVLPPLMPGMKPRQQ